MHLPKYDLKSGHNDSTYFFTSSGENGVMVKLIQFKPIMNGKAYNLSFGDWDEQNQEINDLIVSNNGDKRKILATVVSAVYNFILDKPETWIYIRGSTKSRTRLYRMVINIYADFLLEDFIVIGEVNGKWEEFVGIKEYSSFVFKKRIN